MVVIYKENDQIIQWALNKKALLVDESRGDTHKVYRLASYGEDESKPGGFQEMMQELQALIKPEPVIMGQVKLNLVWLPAGAVLNRETLPSFAKVFSTDKTLHPIILGPFAPKAAAVARYQDPINGFLGKWHERTLFLGDAASAAGVTVTIKKVTITVENQLIESQQLIFSASQRVSMVTDYPPPKRVFLVKYLNEGQVLYDVQELTS